MQIINVITDIKEKTILLHGKFLIKQANYFANVPIFPPPSQVKADSDLQQSVSCSKVSTLNAISLPHSEIVYPGDVLRIPLPTNSQSHGYLSISPSFPLSYDSNQWNPQVCEVINGVALYENHSDRPLLARKYSHFRPHSVSIASILDIHMNPYSSASDPADCSHKLSPKDQWTLLGPPGPLCQAPIDIEELISSVSINTSIISDELHSRVIALHKELYKVFDSDLRHGYNHKAGAFYAEFVFTNKPPPMKVFSPQYNKRCADLLQAKCDQLEKQGVLVDPQRHGISVVHISPSWIQQKGRAKHKNLQDCTLDELRFITAFNALNKCIRPKPTTSCSASIIFMFLARWKWHIFGDLNNSYFQLPVRKRLWKYLGIQTPHKGIRVLTRTGQGLLGSDVELGELLHRVLGEEISAGFCVAIRDDIIIGGKSKEEAIDNYECVLRKLHSSNLKLSPHKVRIFPSDTEVYGYRIKEGCILPSNHTILSLGQTTIDALQTNKHINSWKGLYKTLIGHLPALSQVISLFDIATAGKASTEKFHWTPALISSFNEAMSHLKKINKTYLPRPEEQLILLPDAMSSEPCIGWVLYVVRNNTTLPVMFCTAKLKDYMRKWFPCEKEAVGVVISLDQCAHWILESHHPTLVGPDCLSVVKAADLIRRGKHSSNPRLQSLLASVNRRNIRFFHNSAKAGLHRVPDHLSRMKDKTCNSKDCAIERFLDDVPVNVQAMNMSLSNTRPNLFSLCLAEIIPPPAIIAATSQELSDELIKRSGPIPLGSRQTWMEVQKSDPDCQAVFNMKNFGDVPRKNTTNPLINKMFKESIVEKGLLVVRSFDNRKMAEIDRVIIPPSYLDSILTVIHIKLNHPTKCQLKQVFNRYFFSPRLDTALTKLYQGCHLCISFSKFPKQLESYKSTTFPDCPGTIMNADVLKRAGQIILVNTDLFSAYTTTCFANSEKAEDLAKSIIQVSTPIRRAQNIIIRVDKAPGFISLASKNNNLLQDIGIKLELTYDENKNSNCHIDKIINELETELRKISPDGVRVSPGELAHATMSLNNKIRKRGLTASKIHFSRDAHDNSNLHLEDKDLQEQQQDLRLQNYDKSNSDRHSDKHYPSFSKGDLVFTTTSNSKHLSRDPHIVVGVNNEGRTLIKKAVHSSPFTSESTVFSPYTKTVMNKFIYKPSRLPVLSEENIAVRDQHLTISKPEKSLSSNMWDPISSENDHFVPPIHPSHTHINSSPQDVLHNAPDPEILSPSEDNLGPKIFPDVQEFYDHQNGSDTSEASPLSIRSNSSVSTEDNLTEILTLEDDDPPEIREQLLQNRKPRVNDLISYYNNDQKTWVDAKIIRDLSRTWKDYYNIEYSNGEKDGLYLKPNSRWTFLTDQAGNLLVQANIRSNSAPPSLQPTPNPSPTRDPSPFLSSSEKLISMNDEPSSSSSSSLTLNVLDRTRTESMEWDMSYHDLQPPQQLSISPSRPGMKPVALDCVGNLESVLPLSSTPVSHRPRVSRMRRPLPLESSSNTDHIPGFVRRMLPFKRWLS